MNRDSLFWSAVGALAVGTALLTAYHAAPASELVEPTETPRAASSVAREPRSDSAARQTAAQRSPAPRASRAQSSPSTAASALATPSRANQAEVREALAELVRASRERPARAPTGGAPAADAATRMPLFEMSFEQYRVWAKLGSMLALRDYRAVEELQPDLAERFEPEVVAAMLDATASDYRAYLEAVVTASCEGFDPESVWRKTAFMSLWLGKLERHSPALAAQEQEALRACGF